MAKRITDQNLNKNHKNVLLFDFKFLVNPQDGKGEKT
jgi:hypothetical protein